MARAPAVVSAAKSNVMTLDDLTNVAKQLGEDAGKGVDTQVKFLLKMVEGGYHNVVDLQADKHGNEIDDATMLASAYVKSQGSTVVFDHKAMNQRKLISTLRTAIKLGQWPKGGQGEPLATVNNLMTERQRLRKNPTETKKLQDAANTLLKYARQQLKRDSLIEGDELVSFCYKPDSRIPSAEQVLQNIADNIDKLIEGKAASGTAQNDSNNVLAARKLLQTELDAIAKAREALEGDEDAA